MTLLILALYVGAVIVLGSLAEDDVDALARRDRERER